MRCTRGLWCWCNLLMRIGQVDTHCMEFACRLNNRSCYHSRCRPLVCSKCTHCWHTCLPHMESEIQLDSSHTRDLWWECKLWFQTSQVHMEKHMLFSLHLNRSSHKDTLRTFCLWFHCIHRPDTCHSDTGSNCSTRCFE
jgi:hypothetical protein